MASKKKPNQPSALINNAQFSAKKKDPNSDKRKVKFTGSEEAKTMQIDVARLPKPPRRHPHRRHAGARSRRAR